MNFKTTYWLFAAFVVVLATLGVILWLGPSGSGDINYVIASLHEPTDPVSSNDIDRVEIERFRPDAEKLVFMRDPESKNWRMTEPHPIRVDRSTIDHLVDQVRDARKYENVDLTSNLAEWDLDSPAATITLKKGDRAWKLNLGKERTGKSTGVVYVTSSDNPKQPLAVLRSQLESAFKKLADFRARDLLTESNLNITYVNLQEPKHDPVILAKTDDGRWRYEKPAYGDADYEGDSPALGAGAEAKPITGVRDLVMAIESLRVEDLADFVADGVTDLAKYGLELDKPEKMRIGIKKRVGGLLGGDEKKEPVAEALLVGKKADDKGDQYYARLESENNVIRIAAKKLEPFTKLLEDPALLRNRILVEIDSFKTDAIDIQNGDGFFKLRRPESGGWKVFDAAGKSHKAGLMTVDELLNALAGKSQRNPFDPNPAGRAQTRLVKSFPDPKTTDAQLGLDKPVAVISIWEDGIKKEEKKDDDKDGDKKEDKKDADKKDAKKSGDKKDADAKKDQKKDAEKKDDTKPGDKKEEKPNPDAEPKLKSDKPKIKLSFGKKEKQKDGSELVYVRREVGGEILRVAVPAALLDKATQGKLAYFDKTLPSFENKEDIVRLLVLRDGVTYEIEKEKKDDKAAPWKFKQPKELAGRSAERTTVDRIIDELRFLSADNLIAERASDSDLGRYRLNAPELKAIVTIRKSEKESKDYVYLFGKETEQKGRRYAKQGEHDLVFTVQDGLIGAVAKDPLEDLTVFSFDVGKVKAVKFSGWQDVIGSPYMLELERKGGNWNAKPADFKPLDDAKLDGFLSFLATLKAKRFIAHKGSPKPPDPKETKLDLKTGALEVHITLDGEKEPLTLTIGALKMADKMADGFYAQSNKLAGDLFLIAEDQLIKDAKSKPAHFKKE